MDVRKAILIFVGTLCVGLGLLGMFLPLLPTTVFLLMAALLKATKGVPSGELAFFRSFFAIIPVVVFLAWQREPAGYHRWFRAALRAGLAAAAAAVFAVFAGSALTNTLVGLAGALMPMAPHALSDLTGPGDAQGALATLFTFQASFLLAVGVSMVAGWKHLLKALAALFVTQILFLIILVEITDRTGGMPHALLLRAWAVGLPAALAFATLRPRPRPQVGSPVLTLVPDGPA